VIEHYFVDVSDATVFERLVVFLLKSDICHNFESSSWLFL